MGENGGQRVAHEAVFEVLSLLSGKWESVVVLSLRADGPLGFNELLDAIPDVSGKMLSNTLESLEEGGIVGRRVVNEAPLRVEYDLTRAGRELDPIFRTMSGWGARHLEPTRPTVLVAGADPRHTEMYGEWLAGYYSVRHANDSTELDSQFDDSVDVALITDELPGATLGALFERIKSNCRLILLAGGPTDIDETDLPCDAVLTTPLLQKTVLDAVETQLARSDEMDRTGVTHQPEEGAISSGGHSTGG